MKQANEKALRMSAKSNESYSAKDPDTNGRL